MIRRYSLAGLVVLTATLAARPCSAQQRPASPAPAIPPGAQGKIVLIQGRVQSALAASQEEWNSATLFQPLHISDRVRTLTASRSAILFVDETQVKLNAGAVLTVQQIKTTAGTSTTLSLIEGEGWFRTKNPSSGLTIKTPKAAAAIRGTEINVAVRGDDAVLTVTEGAAEFANDAGTILVSAGEEATATPGQRPTKRTLLNPEDAVQWVLYYPVRVAWRDLPSAAVAGPAGAGFDRLKRGDVVGALSAFQSTIDTDPWSRVGAAMALRELGDPVQARRVAAGAEATGEPELARRGELAAAAMATGDARAARAELEAVLAHTPDALSPLVMLSELALIQNRRDEAVAYASRAVDAHPDSVGAHVAAAEAAQAGFDLSSARRHLDRAIALDATDVRALVDRARIRFGTGDTAGARADIDRAAAIAPADAPLRSLRGFIALAAGDDAAARVDFESAVGADAALGEPHLGLGLVDFRAALYEEGLLEMLTATLLEPKVSLYQSYLGKAYYELRRFPEGLAALASAKRLDPRDPTPWLYASFLLRDVNQQVDALEQLRHAIALNDNRAVYRSRLLLDRDLATKNVSLAEVYKQLGFEAWGAYEALNSLNADLTNASAHLFMADTYGELPDRTQAFASELDQYFLYAPVNLNSFNNFSEYTSLFERPMKQLTLTQAGGSRSSVNTTARTQSGNERFAHVAFIDYAGTDGARINATDQRVQGTGEFKVAFGPSTDLFVTLTGVRQVKGKDTDSAVVIGDLPFAVNVTEINPHPDPTFTHRRSSGEATVGFKRQWRPGSVFTVKADAQHAGNSDLDPDTTTAVCSDSALTRFLGTTDLTLIGGQSNSRLDYPFDGVSFQAQQVTRVGRHQLFGGAEYSRRRKSFGCHDAITSPFFTGAFTADQEVHGVERTAGAYVRDDVEVVRRLHVTGGARYVDLSYDDPFQSAPTTAFGRWNPFAGLSLRVSRVTAIQAAVFRNTNGDFLSSRIAPPTVAGFVFDRNELPTANRDEAAIAVQNGWSRTFVEVRGFLRRVDTPAFEYVPPGLEEYAQVLVPPDARYKSRGASFWFNQILTRRMSLFADDQFVSRDAFLVDRDDNQLRVGLNYINPVGLFARATTRWVHQRFLDTPVVGLPKSSFVLTDVQVSYEFHRKHGLITFTSTNLFDTAFRTVIEDLSVESPLPYRSVLLTVRWRL